MNNPFSCLESKKIAMIGTGVSHNDLIRLFLKKGFDVTVCDRKCAVDLGDIYEEFSNEGAKFILGDDYLDSLCDFDVVFRTPGMYFNNEKLQNALKNGVVVTSEMEMFFKVCPCKIYAVTGSDGKTTTTTLISEFLKEAGKTVHKGGNIGRALLPIVEEISEDDCAVVELSSFQLISMRKSPDVAVITNITPNHLDVHGTMDEYIACKKNVFAHQDGFSRTIFNADDEISKGFYDEVRGDLALFSRYHKVENGAFLRDDSYICYNDRGTVTEIMPSSQIRLPGMHNVENYLTAISAVWGEVPIAIIRRVAENFGGVEHRIEFVRETGGVKWYNDSIATSPTRVMAGINAFTQKLIIIMGGYDKKIPFEPLSEPLNNNAKALILMGATAEKIEKVVVEYEGYSAQKLPIYKADSMEQAVNIAQDIAQSGDIVTLSPACASFDKYPNFEKRGEHFKDLVNEL